MTRCGIDGCEHEYREDPAFASNAVEVIAHVEQKHKRGPRKGAQEKALRILPRSPTEELSDYTAAGYSDEEGRDILEAEK